VAAFYLQYEYWIAASQLILAMLGMGATLTTRDFRDVIREPLSVSAGLGVQLLVVPFSAFLFLQLLDPIPGVAVAIVLIAAIPGGASSNIFTFFARGNIVLSICITALTTLACLVTTPLILTLMVADYIPADFSMPTGKIVTEIALTLLLPLFIGMVYLRLLPGTAALLSKWCIRGSLLGIGLIVMGSLSAGRMDFAAFGVSSIFMVLGFTTVLGLVGRYVPRLLKLSAYDATAVEMEVVVRNVSLGVMIKALLFPAASAATGEFGDLVLFALLLYGGLQMAIAGVLIHTRRRALQTD
jgi:BASS family bile acid:Na+ symporter